MAKRDADFEITSLEARIAEAKEEIVRLDHQHAEDVAHRATLEEETRQSPAGDMGGLRDQLKELDRALGANRRERRTVGLDLSEATKALRSLTKVREAKAAAVPLAPLRAQVDEAKAKLDELRAKGEEHRATIRSEAAPGGDPARLVEAHRELRDLPTFVAFAEHSFYVARQRLLEAEVAHRAVEVDDARQRMEAARPAYEQALADWHALEQDLIKASNQQRVTLSTLSTVRAQVGRSEQSLSP